MFGKMKNMMEQMRLMQHLMKDENFKAFISHPKIQAIFQDPEFQDLLKTQDFQKIMDHPKFSGLKNDRELVQLISRLNLSDFR